jgi:hypothetical protein
MDEPAPRKLYVVQHREYKIYALESAYALCDAYEYESIRRRYPRSVEPVGRAFASRDDATAFLSECEEAARASGNLNPLYAAGEGLNSLLKLTEFDPPVFLDWLTDHDIPPLPAHSGVRALWEAWLAGLSRYQVERLFEALHNLSFYELIEIDWIEGAYTADLWEDWENDLPALPDEPVQTQTPAVPSPPPFVQGTLFDEDIPF